MTAQQMLNVLPALEKIVGLKLPVKKAYKVYSLAKLINEQREFFINEEKKLIEKFNGVVTETGGIQIGDPEKQVQFVKEHNDLMQYEVEGFTPLELAFDDLGDAEITPADLMILEGVINFVE